MQYQLVLVETGSSPVMIYGNMESKSSPDNQNEAEEWGRPENGLSSCKQVFRYLNLEMEGKKCTAMKINLMDEFELIKSGQKF